MGLFDKLFRKKKVEADKSISLSIVTRDTEIERKDTFLPIHPDIRDFIWVGDGDHRNYTQDGSNTISIDIGGISLNIAFSSDEEPSLIYMSLPIANPIGPIDRPPYYPTYKELTPLQRGMYWRLLANPYDASIDIGFVFILYYGLERFLLTNKYEAVIDVILKLRDAHTNKSFQMYSANAIILTCLRYQRADIVQKFITSLDKEHEYSFSPNLYLLCKCVLREPLPASDVMRLAKSFGFSKDNYIKNHPKMFLEMLSKNIVETYGTDSISWDELVNDWELEKLPKEDTIIFANVSIKDRTIKVPSLLTSEKLKQKLYGLLDKTHEEVKKQLADMKKRGEVAPKGAKKLDKNPKEVLIFDTTAEAELLCTYNGTRNNSLAQHFASIQLQDFYYKYRNIDQAYLEKCIEYCKDDISRLGDMQKDYYEETRKKLLAQSWLSKAQIQKEISEIKPFYANIPAFKRLAVIFEKEKDYNTAISVCDQAISYYRAGSILSQVEEFSERRNKLMSKLNKL